MITESFYIIFFFLQAIFLAILAVAFAAPKPQYSSVSYSGSTPYSYSVNHVSSPYYYSGYPSAYSGYPSGYGGYPSGYPGYRSPLGYPGYSGYPYSGYPYFG